MVKLFPTCIPVGKNSASHSCPGLHFGLQCSSNAPFSEGLLALFVVNLSNSSDVTYMPLPCMGAENEAGPSRCDYTGFAATSVSKRSKCWCVMRCLRGIFTNKIFSEI